MLDHRLSSLRASFGDLIVAQAAPRGATFVLSLATAAVLAPEGRGALTLMTTGALLLGAVAFGSLHVPVVNGLAAGDGSALRHGGATASALGGILLACGIGILIARAGANSVAAGSSVGQAGWACIGGGLLVMQLFVVRVLQGLNDDQGYRRTLVLQVSVYACAVAGLLLVARHPVAYFAAWLASIASSLVIALVLMRRRVKQFAPHRRSSKPLAFYKAALANHAGSVGQMLMLRADVLIVGIMLGAGTAGVYGIALTLVETMLVIPEILALSVFARRNASLEWSWWADLIKTLRINALIGLAVAALILLSSLLLERSILAAYGDLTFLVCVLLPGGLGAGYARVAVAALQSRNENRRVYRYGMLAAALSLGYFAAGAAGGAVGIACMSTFACLLTGAYLSRQIGQLK
ncbi:lipopolysaccharide biosynthesis protein [Geodermatophilus sp. SYSU D00766]